ncbi:MAG: hypothetical protein WBE25_12990 [Xanthobacteraceae bacterium]
MAALRKRGSCAPMVRLGADVLRGAFTPSCTATSELGQEQPIWHVRVMSARPSTSDLSLSRSERRFGPVTDQRQCNKTLRYSITSLARPSHRDAIVGTDWGSTKALLLQTFNRECVELAISGPLPVQFEINVIEVVHDFDRRHREKTSGALDLAAVNEGLCRAAILRIVDRHYVGHGIIVPSLLSFLKIPVRTHSEFIQKSRLHRHYSRLR